MIVSASRRTDIPNYYSEWFINRIREGFLYVRNPMNAHQVSKINLSPDVIDCILDKKSNQYVRKTRRTKTLHVLFSIYTDWVRKRCGTKSSAQEGSTDSHISKVI